MFNWAGSAHRPAINQRDGTRDQLEVSVLPVFGVDQYLCKRDPEQRRTDCGDRPGHVCSIFVFIFLFDDSDVIFSEIAQSFGYSLYDRTD